MEDLKSQLGGVKDAMAKESELSDKLRREAMAAASSAQRQVGVRLRLRLRLQLRPPENKWAALRG